MGTLANWRFILRNSLSLRKTSNSSRALSLPPVTASPVPLKRPTSRAETGFILDAISLQDFAFSYSGDSTIPALAGTLDWEGDSLSFSEAKGFLAASQKLRFTDLVIDGKTPDKLEPAITAVFPALRIELTEATNERFHFHQIEGRCRRLLR